jgi:DNA processing protein
MMKYSYWLSNVPGLTKGKIFRLLESIPSAAEIYEASEKSLKAVEGLTEKDVEELIKSRKEKNPEEELMKLSEQGVSFISYEQDDYPSRLRNIFDPPYSLYYRGTLPDEHAHSVAIVGARGRSAYGMEVAEKLAEALAAKQIPVISGMALGIDGDAHKGALAAGGCTYAVLGCGVDYCYPKEHKYLYDRIPEKGGVLSEYPVGTAPLARLFPSRNRIISGLSDCVVVVEARERSGSLITADFAMEQGKDVYAVPGRLTDSLSFGCNSLIRQGAGLMLSIDDFIKEITGSSAGNSFQLDFRKNLLEKDEQLVYSLLDFVPTAVGTLLEKTSFQLLELLEILESMENKGLIREVAPNYYAHTF